MCFVISEEYKLTYYKGFCWSDYLLNLHTISYRLHFSQKCSDCNICETEIFKMHPFIQNSTNHIYIVLYLTLYYELLLTSWSSGSSGSSSRSSRSTSTKARLSSCQSFWGTSDELIMTKSISVVRVVHGFWKHLFKKYLESGEHGQDKDEDKLHVVWICVRYCALYDRECY